MHTFSSWYFVVICVLKNWNKIMPPILHNLAFNVANLGFEGKKSKAHFDGSKYSLQRNKGWHARTIKYLDYKYPMNGSLYSSNLIFLNQIMFCFAFDHLQSALWLSIYIYLRIKRASLSIVSCTVRLQRMDAGVVLGCISWNLKLVPIKIKNILQIDTK